MQDDSVEARYFGEKLSIYDMRNDTFKCFNMIQNKISGLLNLPDVNKYDLYTLFPLN